MLDRRPSSHLAIAPERALLVSVVYGDVSETLALEYLAELAFLAQTAGVETIEKIYQKLDRPDGKTFVGKGKLQEIIAKIDTLSIDVLIFDDELSIGQINHIQQLTKIRVIDRPALILDIFARHARSARARTQVELAQYQYLLPRLKGFWAHLERQGGGVGTRGPGETEIETDRRLAQNKISLLKKRLQTIEKQGAAQRKERGEMVRVALVGYTNVGKSTLMNALAKSDVLAENKLFATLDTTTRKMVLEHTPFLLSDTVGFIRKLPHHLIESFKSTLDEVRESDIILHVVDVSRATCEQDLQVVRTTLRTLEVHEKPTITVLNKMDLYETKYFDAWTEESVKASLRAELLARWEHLTGTPCVLLSALDTKQARRLKDLLLREVRACYRIKYPYKTTYF